MAVDAPVLERFTNASDETRSVPSRMDIVAEEEHNARIRDRYARLINPENKIEDVFDRTEEKAVAPAVAPAPVRQAEPYRVVNARADADIFRADSAINIRRAQMAESKPVETVVSVEEENEDLRPTPTTIQYRTVDIKKEENVSTEKKTGFVLGKREKIIIAVFVAVVVALITLVIVNATIISNLNAEIAAVQENIAGVRNETIRVNEQAGNIVKDILNGISGN